MVIHQGYGVADDATGELITPITVFDIGSISKPFTALAIMQWVEQGRLSVDDPISKFFPDVPADKAGITVFHLLTHGAGLTEYVEDDLAPLSREEALDKMFSAPLQFEAGTRYEYSNAGYTLLAAIVEEISGQPFTDYMHTHVFRAAGMTRSGFYGEEQWATYKVAHTYFNGEGQGSPATWPGPYWGVLGNGGILSTVTDVYQFWEAIHNGTLVSQETAALIFRPYRDEGEADRSFYGYGWVLRPTPYGQTIEHNGGGIGGNSFFVHYPEQDLTIIVSSNRIVYKGFPSRPEIPCRIEFYANEAGEQLAENILANDFSILPEPSLTLCE